MKNFLLPTLAKAINCYLSLDEEAKSRLKKLNAKVISFCFLPFQFTFQCLFTEKGVELFSGETHVAEAKITGTPLQMTGAVCMKEHRQQFFADDLVMEGDAEFAEEVIALFDSIEIDWEEYLSQIVGDAPAYHLGRSINKIKNWFKSADESLAQTINEYVHEEKAWLPSVFALEDFFSDIDTLREDLDRFQAKIAVFEARLKAQREKP